MNTKAATAIAALPFIALFAGASYLNASHIERKTIFVESKERLLHVSTDKDGNSSSSYRNFVYASDETYVVKDSIWNWHFSSGTVYARTHERSSCEVKLSGYRLQFLSLYQNIIAVDCSAAPPLATVPSSR